MEGDFDAIYLMVDITRGDIYLWFGVETICPFEWIKSVKVIEPILDVFQMLPFILLDVLFPIADLVVILVYFFQHTSQAKIMQYI